jgi:hypothetical protein
MKKIGKLELTRVKIGELNQHPLNPNQGDVGAIVESLEAHGYFRPVLVQKSTMNIIAGNHTVQACKIDGLTEIDVIIHDIDDDQALRIMLADNETANKAQNDPAILTDLLESLIHSEFGLMGTGFTGEDLDDLIAEFQPEPMAEVKEPGEIEPPLDPVTKPGDVWLLGPHRLICGDSFEIELPECDVVVSDPPYGMRVDSSWYGKPVGKSLGSNKVVLSNHSYLGKLDWDDIEFDPKRFAELSDRVALFGANYYCTRLPEPGSWWVWDKRATADGGIQEAYGMPFELIWLKGKRKHYIVRHLWAGFTRKAEQVDKERLHPTMKPVAVMREIVEYLSKPNEIVLDPFGGSGSTLIACEQTGRVARLIELDPAYCDVICNRFQGVTGIAPIHEATGEEVSFVD